MFLNSLPVLNICGDRGPVRTSLIHSISRQIQGRGVRTLCLSQDIVLRPSQLLESAKRYDLVLAEDLKQPNLPVLWLTDEKECPVDSQIIAVVERGQGRRESMVRIIDGFLARQWLSPSVLGCLLIGGKSTRMGHAKHLIFRDGRTWLQRTAATLGQVCDQVVVVGQGDIGQCCLLRLTDAPGCSGPIAGLLSAMRSFPWSTILVCACDMPEITEDALRWLLQQRQPGRRAVIPRISGRHEPLLALYDFRFFTAVEAMASKQAWRVSSLAEVEGAYVIEPPPELCEAWSNVNSPEMLGPSDVRKGEESRM